MDNAEAVVFAGVDDGFMETKIVLPGGVMIRIPSQSKAGQHNQINISGESTSVFAYDTDDGPFVVGEIDESDSTKQDEYPVSAMNRVLVSHALRKAGLTNGEVVCACSGLPVTRFYKGKAPNGALIAAKKANLLKTDVRALDGTRIARIARHDVVSEAIAAWLDLVLQRQGGEIVVNRDEASKKTAIVDMGGRTVDIAVLRDFNLDIDRSSTIEVGMLNVQETLRTSLSDRFDAEPTTDQLNRAMRTGVFRIFGKDEAVTDLIEPAKRQIVQSVRAEVMRRLKKAGDIDQVVFAGGTAAALRSHLEGWFPHQVISQDPAFANARGMAKYAEYVATA